MTRWIRALANCCFVSWISFICFSICCRLTFSIEIEFLPLFPLWGFDFWQQRAISFVYYLWSEYITWECFLVWAGCGSFLKKNDFHTLTRECLWSPISSWFFFAIWWVARFSAVLWTGHCHGRQRTACPVLRSPAFPRSHSWFFFIFNAFRLCFDHSGKWRTLGTNVQLGYTFIVRLCIGALDSALTVRPGVPPVTCWCGSCRCNEMTLSCDLNFPCWD